MPPLHPSSKKPLPLRFTKAQRISLARDFKRIYDARVGISRGPLRIHVLIRPVPDAPARLGLSVPARVGTNVVRNRLKRLLREAFRLNQHHLPTGVDILIQAHPHPLRALDDYATLLLSSVHRH